MFEKLFYFFRRTPPKNRMTGDERTSILSYNFEEPRVKRAMTVIARSHTLAGAKQMAR